MNSKFLHFDQLTRYSPYFNLALEEAIAINLLEFGYGGAVRFWSNHNAIVLGISDSVSKNIPREKVIGFNTEFSSLQITRKFKDDKLYITRRASGGGTVFHDEAFNLNYSLFASTKEKPELYPVKESYRQLLGLIIKALGKQNIQADSAGKSDIAIDNQGVLKKISGNAQFRKRDCIVQHGTLLLDLKIIDKVLLNLSHPPEEPDYRKNRKHSDFLTSLPASFSVSQFKLDLVEIFQEFLGLNQSISRDSKFLRQVFIDAKRLMSEKYANIEFIFSKP